MKHISRTWQRIFRRMVTLNKEPRTQKTPIFVSSASKEFPPNEEYASSSPSFMPENDFAKRRILRTEGYFRVGNGDER